MLTTTKKYEVCASCPNRAHCSIICENCDPTKLIFKSIWSIPEEDQEKRNRAWFSLAAMCLFELKDEIEKLKINYNIIIKLGNKNGTNLNNNIHTLAGLLIGCIGHDVTESKVNTEKLCAFVHSWKDFYENMTDKERDDLHDKYYKIINEFLTI